MTYATSDGPAGPGEGTAGGCSEVSTASRGTAARATPEVEWVSSRCSPASSAM